MTPFDPIALVAMLSTFYPLVTRASLERAFRDRPEYFAGGRLGGRNGEVLFLQDGRIIDLAFSAWAANARWQALDVTHADGGAGDPFGLEDGPLVPIDIDGIPPPVREALFESLIAGAAGEVNTADRVIGAHATDLARTVAAAALDDAGGADLEEAMRAVDNERQTFHELDPAGIVTASSGEQQQIDDTIEDIGDPEAAAPQEEPLPDAGPPREDEDRAPRDPGRQEAEP